MKIIQNHNIKNNDEVKDEVFGDSENAKEDSAILNINSDKRAQKMNSELLNIRQIESSEQSLTKERQISQLKLKNPSIYLNKYAQNDKMLINVDKEDLLDASHGQSKNTLSHTTERKSANDENNCLKISNAKENKKCSLKKLGAPEKLCEAKHLERIPANLDKQMAFDELINAEKGNEKSKAVFFKNYEHWSEHELNSSQESNGRVSLGIYDDTGCDDISIMDHENVIDPENQNITVEETRLLKDPEIFTEPSESNLNIHRECVKMNKDSEETETKLKSDVAIDMDNEKNAITNGNLITTNKSKLVPVKIINRRLTYTIKKATHNHVEINEPSLNNGIYGLMESFRQLPSKEMAFSLDICDSLISNELTQQIANENDKTPQLSMHNVGNSNLSNNCSTKVQISINTTKDSQNLCEKVNEVTSSYHENVSLILKQPDKNSIAKNKKDFLETNTQNQTDSDLLNNYSMELQVSVSMNNSKMDQADVLISGTPLIKSKLNLEKGMNSHRRDCGNDQISVKNDKFRKKMQVNSGIFILIINRIIFFFV